MMQMMRGSIRLEVKMSIDKSQGKRQRVEVVTTRLKPELKYLAELGARMHRRSLSNFLEWCVTDALKRTGIERPTSAQARFDALAGDDTRLASHDSEAAPVISAELLQTSIWAMRSELWDEDESNRFMKLVRSLPYLLTDEEKEISFVIKRTAHWKALERNGAPANDTAFVQEKWPKIIGVAASGDPLPQDWPLRATLQTPAKEKGK
jgi:hypothetical protein